MHKAGKRVTSRLSYDLTEVEMYGKEKEKRDYLQRNDNRGSIGTAYQGIGKNPLSAEA